MTTNELHDAIMANTEAKALADAGNDAGCAAVISAALPKVYRALTRNELLTWAAGEGRLKKLRNGVGNANAVISSACDAALLLVTGDGTLDQSKPEVAALVGGLQAAGVLSAGDVAALQAMAQVGQTVSTDEVSAAWLRYRPNGKVVVNA